MRAEAMLHACEPVMFLQVNATSVLVRTLVLQSNDRGSALVLGRAGAPATSIQVSV
jgi:hypothetical protein